MRTASIVGLRIAARLLGSMVEGNPRLMENRNWQWAAQGVAGLIKDVESLNGHAEVEDLSQLVAAMEFSSEYARLADRAARRLVLSWEEEKQLRLDFVAAGRRGRSRSQARREAA